MVWNKPRPFVSPEPLFFSIMLNRTCLALSVALAAAVFSTNARAQTTSYAFSRFAGVPTVAGSNDGTNFAPQFNVPLAVAVDASGNVYVADTANHTVRKISAAGVTTTLAGLEEQNAGLNRLAWMYLRLLSARRVIEHVLEDADVVSRQDLETKRAVLQKQAKERTAKRVQTNLRDDRRCAAGTAPPVGRGAHSGCAKL